MHTFQSKANTFSRNLTAFFDSKLNTFGLATSYIELVLLLKEEGKHTQKELAKELFLAPSTITRFIDKLEKRKLVEKKRAGREVSVELTEEGLKTSHEMEKYYSSAMDELSDMFGEKYIDTVGKLLEFGNSVLNDKEKE